MCEEAHLAAMVSFVSEHVAKHLRANGPGPSPAVSVKFFYAAGRIIERFSEHLGTAGGALGPCGTCLLRGAVRTMELRGNLQMRSCQPDPFGADVVDVREDGCNVADPAGWIRRPCGGIKMFDEDLVDAIICGEDPDCGRAELSVNRMLACGHGSI